MVSALVGGCVDQDESGKNVPSPVAGEPKPSRPGGELPAPPSGCALWQASLTSEAGTGSAVIENGALVLEHDGAAGAISVSQAAKLTGDFAVTVHYRAFGGTGRDTLTVGGIAWAVPSQSEGRIILARGGDAWSWDVITPNGDPTFLRWRGSMDPADLRIALVPDRNAGDDDHMSVVIDEVHVSGGGGAVLSDTFDAPCTLLP